MLKKVEAHRNKVKEILTADQQKQYEQLHAYGNYEGRRLFVNGQGSQNFQGQGRNNQQFARGNTCNSNVNFRGRAGNYQRNFNCANGNGNNGKGRNHFQACNAKYGKGYGYGNGNAVWSKGVRLQDSCILRVNQNVKNEGVEVIE
jgi:hypothetical protein